MSSTTSLTLDWEKMSSGEIQMAKNTWKQVNSNAIWKKRV